MDENEAWKNFTVTGSVADYLKYSDIKHEREKLNEDRNGRTRDKRTGGPGIGQGNNRSDG